MTRSDNLEEEFDSFDHGSHVQGQSSDEVTSRRKVGRRSTTLATPSDARAPSLRIRSVMSDVPADTRFSFLPIIRRSSMAGSVASSIKSSSLYSSSTGSDSPMSGPSTGFSSPAKLNHLPKIVLREMQPGLFDMQDELDFNRAVRFPQLESCPTDGRLNLVAKKLQDGTNYSEPCKTQTGENAPVSREPRQPTDGEREAIPKRKRRKNRKKTGHKHKILEAERAEL